MNSTKKSPPTAPLLVADASPLIALGLVDCIRLLPKLHSKTLIPRFVLQECVGDPSRDGAGAIQNALRHGWIEIAKSNESEAAIYIKDGLGRGESEAIALAKRTNAMLLIDEHAGRTIAHRMGLRIVGTVGILVAARHRGFIPEIRSVLDELVDKNIRLGKPLIGKALRECGEV